MNRLLKNFRETCCLVYSGKAGLDVDFYLIKIDHVLLKSWTTAISKKILAKGKFLFHLICMATIYGGSSHCILCSKVFYIPNEYISASYELTGNIRFM